MIWTITTWVLPVLLCIILHEVAHGYVAMKLGDMTAKLSGRLTLNPLAHIDPVGTIAIPLLLFVSGAKFIFGWAKPVPVQFNRLRHPKRDMGIVAAAGPAANILLAIGFVLIWHIFAFILPAGNMHDWVAANVANGIMLSLALAIFNLIPILPLDGGRIIASILPRNLSMEWQKTERYGFFVLIGLFMLPSLIGVNVIGWFMNTLFPFFLGIVQLFM